MVPPNAISDHALDDYDDCVRIAEDVLAGSDTVPNLVALGAIQYRAGQFAKSIEHLEQADQAWEGLHPDAVERAYTWYLLAMTEQRLGHAQSAREWLKKADTRSEQEWAVMSRSGISDYYSNCSVAKPRK